MIQTRAILLSIFVVSGTLLVTAMLTTSTTFDEIVMISGGARGWKTGNWTIAPEHPPFTQYIYGLPVYLSGPKYPDETGVPDGSMSSMWYRYRYAQHFFWSSGNHPELLALYGRLPAAATAMLLIYFVFFFTRRATDNSTALLAAGIVAFLPDLLAHGGIAYNDVPVTVAIFAAVWMLDRAIRDPGWRGGILAGGITGLALGIKNSAIVLGPISLILLLLEILLSGRNPQWRRRAACASLVTIAAVYVSLVLVYRGDLLLEEYRYALSFVFGQVTETGYAPSYLLGKRSMEGWWYFFPIAFFLKTSAGFHLLAGVGIAALLRSVVRRPREILASPLRAPAVGLAVFAALLLTTKLNIGFRYALPALPMLAVLTAAGVVRAWQESAMWMRTALAASALWMILHVSSYHPHFIAYISEYGPGRDRGYQVLADSSLDWGQGLLDLRAFMQKNGIPRIYLSYFGSALPSGYGIDYVPLTSFYRLPSLSPRDSQAPPRFIVISATNLTGTYLQNDPYRIFREWTPDHVIGHTMFVYRLPDNAISGSGP